MTFLSAKMYFLKNKNDTIDKDSIVLAPEVKFDKHEEMKKVTTFQ